MAENTTKITGIIEGFVIGVAAVLAMAWHFGAFQASAALKQLQRSNDSVTVVVANISMVSDSLSRAAAAAAAQADVYRKKSDSLTLLISKAPERKAAARESVVRLPDTGVARRFQELIR